MATISILNSKGGVGKTVTAVNLAALLAGSGVPTLLVDLDSQYSATSWWQGPGEAEHSVYETLFEAVPLAAAVRLVSPNLFLLAGSPRMEAAERMIPSAMGPDLLLSRVLNGHGAPWRVLILDVPSGWGYVARNAIMACTHLVIPINSERMAFDCAIDTDTRAAQLAAVYSREPCEVAILLTAYRHTVASQEIETLASREWASKLLKTRIRFTEQIKHLTDRRRTVVDLAAATLRDDYTQLQRELQRRVRKLRTK